MHSDSESLVIGMLVLGLSFICSLVHLHCSLFRCLCTARFARALCCAKALTTPLTDSLAHSLTRGKGDISFPIFNVS